jgi:hypothetical protein
MKPAVIKTKKAHAYVGGKLIFDQLKALYPDTLKPMRRTPRGDQSYRVETIDHVLKLAEASGDLLN